MKVPSTKADLRALIERSLNLSYTSSSSKDKIQTGNHYQSVALGNVRTAGFRADRGAVLDLIEFSGKKVLDLGSNLGEISRGARLRGAYLVDGFEYDRYFVEVANLINAYNDVTRVSFYERDITDPNIFDEHYDVVLAFSVFTYIRPMLDKIAAITDQLFVVETHKLDGNLQSDYITPISHYFPFHEILGESDWSASLQEEGKRLVIVFAKKRSALEALGTASSFVASEQRPQGFAHAETTQYIDVAKTPWYDMFFSTLDFDSPSELVAAVGSMEFDVDALARSRDLRQRVLGGWIYWLIYIKGYLQFMDTGTVNESNVYLDYLVRYFGPSGHDPGLTRELADLPTTVRRVVRRFNDFRSFSTCAVQEPDTIDLIDPIRVILRDPPTPDAKCITLVGSDTAMLASIDGYHRLFLARLFGVKKLRGQVVPC